MVNTFTCMSKATVHGDAQRMQLRVLRGSLEDASARLQDSPAVMSTYLLQCMSIIVQKRNVAEVLGTMWRLQLNSRK